MLLNHISPGLLRSSTRINDSSIPESDYRRLSLRVHDRIKQDSWKDSVARRTSLPVSRDSKKRQKSSGIGQLKSQSIMPDDRPKGTIDSKDCVNCDAQRILKDRHQHYGENGCIDRTDQNNMAFSAIMVGGGGITHSRSRCNLNDLDSTEENGRSTRHSSLNFKNRETVIINVGGQVFETYKSTLNRLKSCKLSRESEMKKYYREKTGDYFFDRDPAIFGVVLNYLRTGELHLPTYLCGPAVQREFDYWGVEEMDIERCCWQPYNTWKTQNRSLEKLEYDRKRSTTQKNLEQDRNSPNCWKRWRAMTWTFLQEPSSSIGAKVYAWVSIVFVFMSIFSFCAETHPVFRISQYDPLVAEYDTLYDLFTLQNIHSGGSHDRTEVTSLSSQNNTNFTHSARNHTNNKESLPHPTLIIIDLVCVAFFTVEFVTRFVFCPRKVQFITALQNIIDFIAILPDFIEIIIKAAGPSNENLPFMDFIFILRMLRLCRIFRLIRHVPGLWILLYTLKASFNELMLMFVFLLIGMVIFASLIHFIEPDGGFDNIPVGFWWSVITMTTVGYGDMHPNSALGYIIGSLCAISGLLMIAFTVPIIVSNFVLYYTHVQYGIMRQEREKEVNVDNEPETEEINSSIEYSDNKEESTYIDETQLDHVLTSFPEPVVTVTDDNSNKL